MSTEQVSRFYDNEDLETLAIQEISTRPLVRQLRELRNLETTWAHSRLYTTARWLRDGFPISFTDCSVKRLPDGTIEFTARGKPLEKPAKLPDLKGKKALIIPSAKTLDDQVENCIAPYYTLNGAVNILEILLGVGQLHGQKEKQKRFREFFASRGIELPPPD